jgi:hypothetical protein
MSRYTHFIKLKHLIFLNGGSRPEVQQAAWLAELTRIVRQAPQEAPVPVDGQQDIRVAPHGNPEVHRYVKTGSCVAWVETDLLAPHMHAQAPNRDVSLYVRAARDACFRLRICLEPAASWQLDRALRRTSRTIFLLRKYVLFPFDDRSIQLVASY